MKKVFNKVVNSVCNLVIIVLAVCGLISFLPALKLQPRHDYTISCSASSEDGLMEMLKKTEVRDEVTYKLVWINPSERSLFDDVREMVLDIVNEEVQARN